MRERITHTAFNQADSEVQKIMQNEKKQHESIQFIKNRLLCVKNQSCNTHSQPKKTVSNQVPSDDDSLENRRNLTRAHLKNSLQRRKQSQAAESASTGKKESSKFDDSLTLNHPPLAAKTLKQQAPQ